MSTAPLCLVVDSGGTATRCQAFSCLTGDVVGSVTTKDSNATVVGVEGCVDTILSAITDASSFAKPFAAVWCGVSGADDQSTCDRLHDLMLSRDPGLVGHPDHLLVTNDCDLLAAAILARGGDRGVTLIAGTGSNAMCFRTTSNPRKLFPLEAAGRIGGWGHVLGDEGSGYWIGREACRGVLAHCFDSEPTIVAQGDRSLARPRAAFIAELFRLTGATSIDTFLTAIHAGAEDQIKARIASISPLVTQFAQGEDPFATRIIQAGCDFHTAAALQLAREIASTDGRRPVLVLGGAVFNRSPLVADLVKRATSETFEATVVVDDAALVAGQALTRLWRSHRSTRV